MIPEMTLPEALSAAIRQVVPGAALCRDAAQITDAGGAYLLLMRLEAALVPEIKRFAGLELSPGWYIYCGSAYGPGGLSARLKRHLQSDKSVRWHVDRLSCAATARIAAAVTGGNECDLWRRLSARPQMSIPAPGFGNSDCRSCASHLLRWNG